MMTMMEFAYSLSISLISNSLKEVTVFSNDDIAEVLENPQLNGHNLLLVSNADVENIFNEQYVGILERSNCNITGKVKDCGLIPIEGKYFEADTAILDFVKLDIPYAFVVDEDGI
jgi:hypothetical protein